MARQKWPEAGKQGASRDLILCHKLMEPYGVLPNRFCMRMSSVPKLMEGYGLCMGPASRPVAFARCVSSVNGMVNTRRSPVRSACSCIRLPLERALSFGRIGAGEPSDGPVSNWWFTSASTSPLHLPPLRRRLVPLPSLPELNEHTRG